MDERNFQDIFQLFLLEMEKSASPSKVSKAIEPIAKALRIARISSIQYENATEMENGNSSTQIFYKTQEADREEFCMVHKKLSSGAIENYFAYQFFGDTKWTDDERKRVELVLTMTFVFNEKGRAAQIAKFLAFHDRDFGIYNLTYFKNDIDKRVRAKTMANFSVCQFSLKRFSYINDQYGHKVADSILIDFIVGLKDLLEKDEILARISNVNFVVLFKNERLETIKSYLAGQEITVSPETKEKVLVLTYAGFFSPKQNSTPVQILDAVNDAMDIAKNILHKSVVFYDDTLTQKSLHAKMVENLFPAAIKNEEFVVYYQPKVRLTDYRLAGAEALCRWIHSGKIVSPNDFIPALEQNRAISLLDFYMLEHVCRDIRKWLDAGIPVVKISVNLSRCHFGEPDLLGHIISIPDKYKVPHHYIEIELTETTTDVDFNDLRDLISGLQMEGFSTSIDDFGVGYSSLNLIRQIPWNIIKIDKSFLPSEGGMESTNDSMIKLIVNIARTYGIDCIVEGVETVEHVKILKENNCLLAQGYYFDPPLKKAEFERRLSSLLE